MKWSAWVADDLPMNIDDAILEKCWPVVADTATKPTATPAPDTIFVFEGFEQV